MVNMPPNSKRKFTSYQEPFGTAMARQPSNRGGFVQRPVPTPETQDLYNKMRQEEEKQEEKQEEEKQLTQESLSHMQNGHNGFLQPHSPSQATASSPAPSYASTTYSISQAMDGMGVDDQPRLKRPKPGRRGPLPEAKKLRAFLIRKLGACDDCQRRKVGCSHLDLTLFEDAYRAAQRVPTQPINNGYHPASASPYRSPLGDPSVDFLGVGDLGVGQNYTGHLFPPSQGGIQAGRDDAYMDFDLSQNQRPRPDVESLVSLIERPQPPVPSRSPQYAFAVTPSPAVPTQSSQEVPIGKQVSPYISEWVCLWGSDEYGSSWSRGKLGPCNQSFSDLETLRQHFTTFHIPFHRERRYWRCIDCGLDMSSPDPDRPCPQCSQPFTWHEWCWAKLNIPSPSGPPSLSLGPVPSQDGPSSSHSSWNRSAEFPSASGGHNNSWTAPFGGYWYSNGSGSGYHYTAAHAASPTGSKRPTACCGKPTLATCHSGSSLIDMLHPASYSDKTAGKTALLRHACPAAVVLAVFLIALVNSWLFTGRGRHAGVEYIMSSMASSMFPSGQIKIPDLSIAFIIAGVVVSWLVRHVKSRWKEQSGGRQFERGCVRGVVGSSHFGEDGSGPVGIAAA